MRSVRFSHALRTWLRAVGVTLAVVYFLCAATILALKYGVLPNIGKYSERIEQAVSGVVGERVTIGEIRAHWQGLRAELHLIDVVIHDREGRAALTLPEVEAVVGWRSIPLGSLRLHSLTLERPDLRIRRDPQGKIFVAGMPLRTDDTTAGSSNWVLEQPEIVVRDAQLSWDDELRGAPTLPLTGVQLVIQNGSDTHRFSLRAQTSPELASALDLRAELRDTGEARWDGKLYAELDYVDLAAWKPWIDYPLEIQSGHGAVRAWVAIDHQRLTNVTADLALADIKARLAPDLRLLELDTLRGRLSGSDDGSVRAFGSRNVELKMAGEAAFPPSDLQLRLERGKDSRPARGEAAASVLELEPLARLVEYLPLPKETREHIAELEPRGTLRDFKLEWTGEFEAAERYAARTRFSGLGLKALGPLGALSGASGTLEASQAGGSVRLDSQKIAFELPRLLPAGPVQLDSLAGTATWTRSPGRFEVRFSNAAFANRDIAGSANGSYARAQDQGPGVIDVTGTFARADARSVHRYIPFLPRGVEDYLKGALQAGQLTDGRLRIKGDLREFPFADPKSGTFQVSGRVAGGELEFASGWPRLTAITGELRFDGPRMQAAASRAVLAGARLSNVRVQIPELFRGDEVVRVEGQADASVPEFLRFIDTSPVGERIGGVTKPMSGNGPGRLQITLELPIRRLAQTKVAGAFQFSGNPFTFDPSFPPLQQLAGRLEFTEETLSARSLSAQFLGGPATFSIATRPERTFVVTAQGNATVAAVQRMLDAPWWLEHASGGAAWTGTATLGPGRVDVQVDSPLAGVTIAMPPPFAKRAGEAMPLRVERTNRSEAEWLRRLRVQRLPPGGDAIAFRLGSVSNGVFIRARPGEAYALQRGAVGVNEAAPPLEASGVVISGNFASFDLDRWRSLLKDDKGSGGGAGPTSIRIAAETLVAGGKRFNEVKLRAIPASEGWYASVTARELDGAITWLPQGGRGKIVARLKRFNVPDAPEEPAAPAQVDAPPQELPALDVIADAFITGEKTLGRLELIASNEGRDWRIEKLLLANADGALQASGAWQNWATRPSVALNLKLDVSDIGNFMTRVGFPGTMRSGSAHLEGKLTWQGSPQSIDYPSLAGELRLNAEKGQFLRADPGIAKLLGIINLQSWITLDVLRTATTEGFDFTTLGATARISKGILATDDFSMIGKPALVTMSGTVDLAQETQSLKARVVPRVGDTASTLLLFSGPITALGAWLAQRILKDPLGRIFAVEYSVTGTWTEPRVERIRSNEANQANTGR